MDVSIFNKWKTALPVIVSDELKKAQVILQVYVQDNLHGAKKLAKGERNNTDKLYSKTGKLLRALQIGGNGNLFDVKTNNGVVTLLTGIDVSVVPYARIHEYGGTTGRNGATKLPPRPYLNPAMKEFVKEEIDGVLERIVERLLAV